MAQLPSKIADLNARFSGFLRASTARRNIRGRGRMREISLKDIDWSNDVTIRSGDIEST